MVIFFFGNNVCFCRKCLKVFVCQCEGEGTNIAAIQGGHPNKLVLPGEQYVDMLGDAGVAVIMLLLFRHGLLHPMLWREQPNLTSIWDVVGVQDGVVMDHALVIFPASLDCADLDILHLCPPNPLMEPEMNLGVLMKSEMSWEMQVEHWLSMPMDWESVSKQTCSSCCAHITISART